MPDIQNSSSSQANGKFVVMMESPSLADLKRQRVEGKALVEMFELLDVSYTYAVTPSRADMQARIDHARELVATRDMWPVFHISAHGNDDGIQLTDGDILSWQDIGDMLEWAMRDARGLEIAFSSCEGIYAAILASRPLGDPIPRWVIGYDGKPTWAKCLVAYTAFYYHLFKTNNDVTEAAALMGVTVQDGRFRALSGDMVQEHWLNRKPLPPPRLAPLPPGP